MTSTGIPHCSASGLVHGSPSRSGSAAWAARCSRLELHRRRGRPPRRRRLTAPGGALAAHGSSPLGLGPAGACRSCKDGTTRRPLRAEAMASVLSRATQRVENVPARRQNHARNAPAPDLTTHHAKQRVARLLEAEHDLLAGQAAGHGSSHADRPGRRDLHPSTLRPSTCPSARGATAEKST
jgi:hypothetical protein